VRRAEATEIGPLIDDDQRDWVHNHVEDAVHNGAELRAGGRIPDCPGCFYPPTVLVGPPADAPVLAQELTHTKVVHLAVAPVR
jgi:succinate-semialdehyde dehydrogenase / glutarate-semialdehyde dehydrogenase